MSFIIQTNKCTTYIYIYINNISCTVSTPTCFSVSVSSSGSLNLVLACLLTHSMVQSPGLQLVKKFPAFHGIRRFITALISVRHLSLSWASPIQSIHPHPTSCRSILILFTHLSLGLPSGLLPSGFPSKTLYTPLSSPICANLVLAKVNKIIKIIEFTTQ